VRQGGVISAIQDNLVLGDKLRLSGTPAFVVGDEVISGAVGSAVASRA
jgi:protein-disulfide isomerase